MINSHIIDKILGVATNNEIGSFSLGAYKIANNNMVEEVIILYCGELSKIKNVRINSACFTGDLFHCNRCDCNEQLVNSIKYFWAEKNGLLIYLLNQDGRGCGTVNKLRSLALMDRENVTTKRAFEKLGYKSDSRHYASAVTILKDLKINNINLITNNPQKISYLESKGIRVVNRIPTVSTNPLLRKYLKSKQDEFNHFMGM